MTTIDELIEKYKNWKYTPFNTQAVELLREIYKDLQDLKQLKEESSKEVDIKRTCVNCFCTNCGKFLDIHYNYCFECGAKIKWID